MMTFMAYQGAVMCGLVLLGMLVLQEIARISVGPTWRLLTQTLTVGIVPLLFIFLTIVAMRVVEAFK
jgi:hypothetical protein